MSTKRNWRRAVPLTPIPDFAAQIRATAKQIERDVASGALLVTEYGYRTQAELDAAVYVDGGIVWPSRVSL